MYFSQRPIFEHSVGVGNLPSRSHVPQISTQKWSQFKLQLATIVIIENSISLTIVDINKFQ